MSNIANTLLFYSRIVSTMTIVCWEAAKLEAKLLISKYARQPLSEGELSNLSDFVSEVNFQYLKGNIFMVKYIWKQKKWITLGRRIGNQRPTSPMLWNWVNTLKILYFTGNRYNSFLIFSDKRSGFVKFDLLDFSSNIIKRFHPLQVIIAQSEGYEPR